MAKIEHPEAGGNRHGAVEEVNARPLFGAPTRKNQPHIAPPTATEKRAAYRLYAPRRDAGWRPIGELVADIIANLETARLR